MSDEKPEKWPLLPAHSAYVLHGLCIALADVTREEVNGEISHRALLKGNGLASAAELFANEVAHFFSCHIGSDHELLEAVQERYAESLRGD